MSEKKKPKRKKELLQKLKNAKQVVENNRQDTSGIEYDREEIKKHKIEGPE